jgi:hypothetical protein
MIETVPFQKHATIAEKFVSLIDSAPTERQLIAILSTASGFTLDHILFADGSAIADDWTAVPSAQRKP